MSDNKQDKNAEHERIVRERSQLERLHFMRVAGEASKSASKTEPTKTQERPSDDEIMSLMRAFYGRPDTEIVEWLASIQAVRESVMLSMGDA